MLKIAICDDSPYDVEILESAFDQLGNKRVEYDIYFSADELLTHIKENGDSYQMYILDIEMPGKKGLELASFLPIICIMSWMSLKFLLLIS